MLTSPVSWGSVQGCLLALSMSIILDGVTVVSSESCLHSCVSLAGQIIFPEVFVMISFYCAVAVWEP